MRGGAFLQTQGIFVVLLEYIGPQDRISILRRGVPLTWEPQERHGGAKVLDVTDPDIVRELMLSRAGTPSQPQFRVFWVEALRDPEFVRYIVRNPISARYVLDHPDEFPETPEAIADEVRQASEARIRAWAAQLAIPAHPQASILALSELILSHYRRENAPTQPSPPPPAVKKRGPKPKAK